MHRFAPSIMGNLYAHRLYKRAAPDGDISNRGCILKAKSLNTDTFCDVGIDMPGKRRRKKKYIACWLARFMAFDHSIANVFQFIGPCEYQSLQGAITQCRPKLIGIPIDTSLFVHAMMLMLESTFSERVLSI